jgi:ATP-dependent RNA helicase DeaD
MDQKMRSKVMERFKNRSLQAIVATDVAARGIDVNDITHVINYELPDDPEVYTHRSGRTARAGKSGICMSIVSPKQISNIRQIERLVKQKFHKSDIPDGAEVVRKRLFFYMEQIATAEPKDDFAKLYYDSMHEQFADVDKDELIRKLIWLQLKDTIDAYQDAEDLNAGFESKSRSGGSRFVRLFINIGEKDGLNAQRLVQFITESTDVEPNVIERVTVRDLSSFFNVPADAADYIKEHLSQKKFKNRKVRLEEAEQSRGGHGGGHSSQGGYGGGEREHRGGGGGGESRGSYGRQGSSRFSGDVKSYGRGNKSRN